ncbi:unnamed protein product [Didymodactylos carnosus]|uniref:Uncharacterized protein n=1 Tax=Didymodactylos carnosus TaxID=1234261 RepID=A0A814E4I5_9BILA|nr:unnamed protein product [Didymodactylos carnosus]CAF0961275.1 unnamed protein product [Didymodactylos carnosus]CAF3690434.1 unnamed protein product [Didymodactylos carnosus]CAF3735735.1 unnamed protein product [Didymodactylos carnosus]
MSGFGSTNPTAGAINEGGGSWARKEKADENMYFLKQENEILEKMRQAKAQEGNDTTTDRRTNENPEKK